jgi:hypothetical protein
MRDDRVIDATLDQLLAMWHRWQDSYRLKTGYPKTAAGCSQYRCSRQWDDSNGALDLDADVAMCEAIDAEVNRMADPHRTAIHVEARNLVSVRVFRSARLTEDPAELRRITAEARAMLWKRLESAGVV